MEENSISITVSKVIEYLYCPRTIFFLDVLGIPKNEMEDFKVKTGKEIHEKRLEQNKGYLRKNIKVIKKEMDISLNSKKNFFHGKLDELLFLEDGTIVPLDYKFSEYTGKVYDTYKYQLAMYSMMIEENYNVESRKGYIVFTRSNNKLKEIEYNEEDFSKVRFFVNEILEIINKGVYPLDVENKNKCKDCCYRKVCNED